MIDAKQIPPEVVEAAAKADYEMTRDETLTDHGIMASSIYCPWGDLSADGQEYYKQHARASITAALNAWPEMECRPTFGPSRIILPLTQENRD